jgi:hypothetical protein
MPSLVLLGLRWSMALEPGFGIIFSVRIIF